MSNTGNIKIPMGAQNLGAYLAQPDGSIRGTLLLIQEIFGVTPAMRAIADDFAAEGYLVLVPDIYWRLEPDLDLGNGEDAEQRQRAVDYSNRYDEALGTDDLVAAVEWLNQRSRLAQRPAAAGFCLGGRLAVRLAARTILSCAVSMYGVNLDRHGDEIRRAQCPMQFHFGENDNHNPLPKIEAVRAFVSARKNPTDEFFTYPQAQHAFYNRFRLDRFNLEAHDIAHARMLAFLARHA